MSTEILISDLLVIIKENIKFLIKKVFLITTLSLSIGFLTATVISFRDVKYTAEISLINENDNTNKFSSYASLASLAGIDMGTATANVFEGENLIELLKSKRLVAKTLFTNYDNKQIFIKKFIQNHKINRYTEFAFDSTKVLSRSEDSLVRIITDKIVDKELEVVKKDKKNDLIVIRFTDKDELFAKKFIDQLVENTINYYIDYKTKKTIINVNIFQKQVDSLRSLIFSNISNSAAASDENINPSKQSGKINIQKHQIVIQSNSALYIDMIKNLELTKISFLKEKPFIQIIDKSTLPLNNNKIIFFQVALGAFFLGIVFVSLILLYNRNVIKE